ncbi:hypothetical protein KAU33_10700, partial [Candidatus Dependentiae bacterium]|nr:hypothetical protein [Candidatus Dependentiae bacterium]
MEDKLLKQLIWEQEEKEKQLQKNGFWDRCGAAALSLVLILVMKGTSLIEISWSMIVILISIPVIQNIVIWLVIFKKDQYWKPFRYIFPLT